MYSIGGSNFSIFGGINSIESCIQQTVSKKDLNNDWECVKNSESALEGFSFGENGGRPSSHGIRFSNFRLSESTTEVYTETPKPEITASQEPTPKPKVTAQFIDPYEW